MLKSVDLHYFISFPECVLCGVASEIPDSIFLKEVIRLQNHVILEIPEQSGNPDGETEWQPPVLSMAEEPEPETVKKQHLQSCADVFFVQYIVCVCLLTILFSVKVFDAEAFRDTVLAFETGIHAPTELWVEELIQMVKNLWN